MAFSPIDLFFPLTLLSSSVCCLYFCFSLSYFEYISIYISLSLSICLSHSLIANHALPSSNRPSHTHSRYAMRKTGKRPSCTNPHVLFRTLPLPCACSVAACGSYAWLNPDILKRKLMSLVSPSTGEICRISGLSFGGILNRTAVEH